MDTNISSKHRTAIKIVDKWLDYYYKQENIPSVSVGIIYKDKTLFTKSYGYADIDKKVPATIHTNYRIASNSKVFTGVAILQLVEKDKIRLDEKVVTYLPWINAASKKDLKDITIRHLLSHSAGIMRDGLEAHWETGDFPSVDEIKAQILKGIKVLEPLTEFKYSNLGFSILGLVIEAVTGQKYEEYITDHIFKPLDMLNTYTDLTANNAQTLATGYKRPFPGDLKRSPFKHYAAKGMAPATGFISNVVDLCKFLPTHLSGNNTLLSSVTKREMQKVQLFRPGKPQYGLGVSVREHKGMRFLGHGGGFQGFTTRTGVNLDNNIGVIVLTNDINADAGEILNSIHYIFHYIDQNFNKKPQNKFDIYEGLYSNNWTDIEVASINGHLVYYYPHTIDPLESVSIFEPKGNTKFKIKTSDGYDYIGEDAEFIVEKGEVKELKIGTTRFLPFGKYWGK